MHASHEPNCSHNQYSGWKGRTFIHQSDTMALVAPRRRWELSAVSHVTLHAARSSRLKPLEFCHLAPLGFALARPLPLVPLPTPRPKPPRLPPGASVPTRLLRPDGGLEVDAGAVNLDMDFEDGGFSTNEVSVVLEDHCEICFKYRFTRILLT